MSIESSFDRRQIESDEDQPSWRDDSNAKETFAPIVDSVGLYLNRLGKIKLLDAIEEVELAKEIEVGLYAQNLLEQEAFTDGQELHDLQELRRNGEAAKKRLAEANLRLVVPIARRYRGKGVPFLDLIQEGNLGLMNAIQNYDYAKGFRFSTFATQKIAERIIRSFFTQGHNNPVDRKTGEQLSKLSNITKRLSESLGRKPTIQELAVEMKLDEQKVHDLLFLGHDTISLDMGVGEFDTPLGVVLEDTGSNDPLETLIQLSMRDEVGDMLARFDHHKETIVRGRFGFDEQKIIPHQTLARQLKLSCKKVKELEEEILDELRSDEHVANLHDYLY